ncbi:MAG: methionine--tRNA ligase [Ruminococcaceae bacterium]|nr:methionine--tRNA ligase [Oscillospiraceae bacterium]
MKEKFYITTAIAYTSRIPHIGNTYEAILADSIARYKRMTGYDVYFLTGTDEHGQKIQKQALEEGITPQEHVDNIAGEIRKIWDLMNVSYDGFIRTTDPKHVKAVQKIFKKLYDQGDIYKNSYDGLYCTPCESFFTETQAPDGVCPECGAKLEHTSEEAYFFKLSNYTDRLKKYIEDNPDFIQPPARKNEMLNNFINAGLSDLCVSRTAFDWGVPVTFDDKHVIYVWIDALSNYITALDFDIDGNNGELYNKYWPADVHLIGKDILRFHTIYWPIMLMALGLPLPKQVFGHPWLLSGNDKMSKSKGNVIYASDLVEYFGVDAVRYYVLHEMPFAQDGTFTYELIIERYNSDLANILGNLVNRTLAMVSKYFDGIIPTPNTYNELDNDLKNTAINAVSAVESKMNELKVADSLDEIWALLRRSNKYIDETAPWILAKSDEGRETLKTVLYNLMESIRFAAILMAPYLPETSQTILNQLATDKTSYETLTFGALESGKAIGEFSPIFNRLDEKLKLEEIAKHIEDKYPQAPKAAPFEPEITFEDFMKTDLRAAKILECEKIKKSEKLLKLIVDDGIGKRQIVSGIAKFYTPEQLIGKTVAIVANLKPVKLCGVESCGMIIAADKGDDVCVLFLDDSIPAGSKIR